ncbi:MAG: hypothetical protein Q9218_005137 [Villophora microphyllina]
MVASTLILPDSTQQLRTQHGKASKTCRLASEALNEADQAAQGARGKCFEWMSSRLNPDAEFFQLREEAAKTSGLYCTLLDEYRAAQALEMRSLHNELDHLEAAVNALQTKLGITITGTPIPSGSGSSGSDSAAAPTAAT